MSFLWQCLGEFFSFIAPNVFFFTFLYRCQSRKFRFFFLFFSLLSLQEKKRKERKHDKTFPFIFIYFFFFDLFLLPQMLRSLSSRQSINWKNKFNFAQIMTEKERMISILSCIWVFAIFEEKKLNAILKVLFRYEIYGRICNIPSTHLCQLKILPFLTKWQENCLLFHQVF